MAGFGREWREEKEGGGKEKPEGVAWHIGDWGSKLLFKARAGTLEVNARKRDGGSCGQERERQ